MFPPSKQACTGLTAAGNASKANRPAATKMAAEAALPMTLAEQKGIPKTDDFQNQYAEKLHVHMSTTRE